VLTAPPTNNETIISIIAGQDIVNIDELIAVFSPAAARIFYERCAREGLCREQLAEFYLCPAPEPWARSISPAERPRLHCEFSRRSSMTSRRSSGRVKVSSCRVRGFDPARLSGYASFAKGNSNMFV
jgi:hypothetical protein